MPIDERSLIDGLDHRLWGDGAGRPPISLLARLVAALAHHRTGAPGAGLDADALFARG